MSIRYGVTGIPAGTRSRSSPAPRSWRREARTAEASSTTLSSRSSAIPPVEFPLLLQGGLPGRERAARVGALLEAVGIADHARHRPSELSGGQRQRVAIARALVTRPALVLADEPTANLDSQTGSTIIDLMKDLNRREGTTFVFSTHDPKVMSHASAVVRIADGQIVAREAA